MLTMSEWGKRAGAVFLSMLATAAVLVGNAPKALAEEYRYPDPYVLSGEFQENGMLLLTCGDASVLAYPLGEAQTSHPGQQYRRLNLEDAERMDAARAGKIRAVLRTMEQDLSALTSSANLWLGEASVRNLTEAEAVTAAREAISRLAGAEVLSHGSVNVEALISYLWALPPVVSETLLISDSSLHIRSAVTERQPEGTYRTEIEFTTTATLVPGDELTVTVFCGDQQKSFPLTEENREDVHRVVFTHEERAQNVRVEVNGYQQGADVFLFAPSGAPGDASLLAGCHSGRLPVHAEAAAPVAGEPVLEIYADVPVEVEIYQVAQLWELLSGVVTPDAANTGMYKTDANHVAHLTLDGSGSASVKLNTEGVYLISGKDAAVEDAFVCVPTPRGEGWQYRVTVEPERGMYLLWWSALIGGLLAGIAVAVALVLRLKRK